MKRITAWMLIAFVAMSTPASLLWFAKDEPPFVVVLSELALLYTAIDMLWQAKQMEEGEPPTSDGDDAVRMIELTRVNDSACWVNAYAIAGIERNRDGSIVHIIGGASFVVKESPEVILGQMPEPA